MLYEKSKRRFFEEWGDLKKTGRKILRAPTQCVTYRFPHRYLQAGDVLQFEDPVAYNAQAQITGDTHIATVISIIQPPEEAESGFYRLELLWDSGHISVDDFHTLEFEIINEMEISHDY